MFGRPPTPPPPPAGTPVQPPLHTERLVLRPFTPDDAPDVHRLVAEREIAATTLNIPHPYLDGMAAEWISRHPGDFERGEGAVFAVTLRDGGELAGAVGFTVARVHRQAELGYWIGRPYWGRGYATEAARAALRWAFAALDLHRVVAHHMTRNPASGAVLRKLGMRHEGTLRQ
ncbi:MAG TPA: GNAT family N-acetyltransferase, partial [Longimicrobiaceae bacterium]|nr:GNAT family N-acetyltransferase [Longimicrobiaceae bacterium]